MIFILIKIHKTFIHIFHLFWRFSPTWPVDIEWFVCQTQTGCNVCLFMHSIRAGKVQ